MGRAGTMIESKTLSKTLKKEFFNRTTGEKLRRKKNYPLLISF